MQNVEILEKPKRAVESEVQKDVGTCLWCIFASEEKIGLGVKPPWTEFKDWKQRR